MDTIPNISFHHSSFRKQSTAKCAQAAPEVAYVDGGSSRHTAVEYENVTSSNEPALKAQNTKHDQPQVISTGFPQYETVELDEPSVSTPVTNHADVELIAVPGSEPGMSYQNWQQSADYEPVDLILSDANPQAASVNEASELTVETKTDTATTEYAHLEPTPAAAVASPAEYTTLQSI